MDIQLLKHKVLGGETLSDSEVYALADAPAQGKRAELRDAAAEVTRQFCPATFEFCSIVNARSGSCPENCKWCAQSAHFTTGCDTYPIVDPDECRRAARINHEVGIKRFSLVASGRRVTGRHLREMCTLLAEARDTGLHTCASLGLLTADDLRLLWESGVRRYHCNLETAPSYFPTLVTTHTIDDKMATIRAAKEIGFEICSGGIIGMGETPHQRAELALKLREVDPVSIPINVLHPIPGTPLADTPLISADEIIDTVAMFRMAHPRVQLRFAGGRARLGRADQLEAIRVGINSAIAGDMLTTIGSTIASDKEMIAEAGLELQQ